MCGTFYCHENVKIAHLLPDKVTAFLSANTVDKTHNATEWLALSHKDNVTLEIASDGILHFWQPVVVLTSHMDHSRMFHCLCLQQASLKFQDIKTVLTTIHGA